MKTIPCDFRDSRGECCDGGKINDHYGDGYVSRYECPQCNGSGRVIVNSEKRKLIYNKIWDI